MATLEELQSIELPAGGIVRLSNIPWEAYEGLRNIAENRNIRMTYVRGILEMMSPSKRHERVASILGRLIEAWTEVIGVEIQSCRTTTFKRQDLETALEPDNCYYIQREREVRDRDELDLKTDPPPDLVVEVDVSSSSLNRLPVYAAIGVPEVWRWQREQIQVFRLDGENYRTFESSQVLVGFPIEQAAKLIRGRLASGENALVREFRNLISNQPTDGAGQGSA